MKPYLIALGSIVILFAAIFGLEKLAEQSKTPPTLASADTSNDTKVEGPSDAPVTLIEYSDFQCPACAAYTPLVRNLRQDFPNTLKVVYRHFPLTTIHKNALPSAKAAEAALRQGKFWEMHDQLFEHQTEWAQLSNPTETFQVYAKNAGLDVDRFNNDIASDSVAAAVAADQQTGTDAAIQGTPTFFLNGTQLKGPQNYEEFKQLVEDELAKTRK